MSLDLGELLGSVDLIITPFERKYSQVVSMMARLGVHAESTGASTGVLDEGLAGVGASANTAATGLGRADEALAGAGASASRATAATKGQAAAIAQLAAVSQPLVDVTTELGLAQSKNTQATLRAAAAQARLDVVQESGKATSGQLAAAQASLIAANDRLALSEERVSKANMLGAATSNRLRSTWEGIPGPVKVAAVAILATGAASLDAAKHFQDMTTRIHTQAHASIADTRALSSGMLHLSGIVGVLPTQLADAGYHVASVSQGILSVSRQLDILKIAAEGAKLGNSDLVDTTNALDAAVVSGIKGVDNYSQAMGALNATVGAGDMTMQDLADAFGTGLPASMAAFNVTLTQTGAALAVLGDNNIRGARAGTQLRMSVQALEHPVATATDALGQLGITGANAVNHFAQDLQHGGLTTALEDLHQRLVATGNDGKKSGQILTDIFGKRAGIGVNVLINEYDRYQSKLHDVSTASKQFSSDWDAYTKTFSFAVDRVKAGAVALGVALGNHLLPEATKAVGWLGTTGIDDLEKFGHALASNSMVTGGFNDLTSALHHIADAIGNIITATEPLDRILLTVGGAAVLAGFRALAAIIDEVASVVDHLTGFFADNQAAAIALSAIIATMLVPAIVESVVWFGRMIAMNVGAAMMVVAGTMTAVGEAFIAAGGGVAGFGAALEALNINPVMLAVTALVVASAELIHLFNGQEKAALAAGKAMADTYIRTLDTTNTSIATMTRNTAGLQAQMDATWNQHLSLPELAAKLHELNQTLDSQKTALAQAKSNVAAIAQQYGITTNEVNKLARANGVTLSGSLDTVAANIAQILPPSAMLHQSEIALGKAAQGSSRAVQALNTQLGIMAGNAISADQGITAFHNDIVALDKALNKSSGSLDRSSQAGRDARDAFDAAAAQAINNANAQAKLKNGTDKARATLEREIGVLQKHAGSSDYAKTAIQHLQSALDKIPQSSDAAAKGLASGATKMSTATAQAVAQILAKLKGLKGEGLTAGENLALGLAAGIEARSGVAIAKAEALGARAAHGINTGAGNKSPSRKTKQSGRWIGQGLILGMESMLASVTGAGDRLGNAAAHAAHMAVQRVLGTIAKATAPDVTDPSQLASILSGDTHHAARQRFLAMGAKRHAVDVKDWATAWANYAKQAQHAANVADRAAQKHSKDKHLQQVAHDADQAAKAAQRMANQTSKAADKADAAYTKLANSAKSSAQKAGAAAQSLVTELQSEIDSIASAVSDFETSISQGLTSGHGLSDVWQNLLDSGKATVTNLQGSLDDILTSTRRFDTDLQRLADEGASQDLIDQLAGMGDAGKALAEQLLAAGPGAITQLSNTLTNIQKVADSTGVALADTFYGAGLHSMERYIKGLEKKFPELRKALNPILHEINHILDGGGASAANFAAVSIPVAGGDGAALGAGVFSSMDARLGRIETLLGAAPAAHADAVKPVLTAAADAHATRIQTIQRSDA